MAVSDDDIALISTTSRLIYIFHLRRKTYSMVSHRCKKISAPFDGVYSNDNNQKTALYLTETENGKRGVKILYSKTKQLKIRNFTNRVENPRGISANYRHIFVCDASRASILVFKKDGEMILSVSNRYSRFQVPLYVFAEKHDRLIVTDQNTHSVRELSGINDGCKVISQYKQLDFSLAENIFPGKCCTTGSGSILIPDSKSWKIFDSVTKDSFRLDDEPIAVAMSSPSEIVVATYRGKVFSITQPKT